MRAVAYRLSGAIFPGLREELRRLAFPNLAPDIPHSRGHPRAPRTPRHQLCNDSLACCGPRANRATARRALAEACFIGPASIYFHSFPIVRCSLSILFRFHGVPGRAESAPTIERPDLTRRGRATTEGEEKERGLSERLPLRILGYAVQSSHHSQSTKRVRS